MRRRRSSAGSDDSASANTASGPPSLSTPSHSSCEDLEAQGACVTVGDVVASLLKSKAVLRIADEIWEAMHANGQPKTPSAWNSSLRLQPPGPGSTISIASTGPEDDLLDYDRYMRMHFAIQVARLPDPPAEALEDGPDREGRPAPRPTTPLELPSRLEPGRDRDRDREAGEPRLPRATAAALRRTGADLAWLAVQNRLARRLRSFGAVGSSPSFEFATFYC
eukprot:tig00001041_g6547.t1